ncbi:MAG: hypothetical protein ACLU4N_07475 [Butyricimonas faecihominis]
MLKFKSHIHDNIFNDIVFLNDDREIGIFFLEFLFLVLNKACVKAVTSLLLDGKLE